MRAGISQLSSTLGIKTCNPHKLKTCGFWQAEVMRSSSNGRKDLLKYEPQPDRRESHVPSLNTPQRTGALTGLERPLSFSPEANLSHTKGKKKVVKCQSP